MEHTQTGQLNNDFRTCLAHLMENGMTATPRGTTTKELLNYNISLMNPRNRIINFPDRKTNLKYLLGELVWYFSGSNDPAGILPYSKFWDSIRNPDGTINSNYGHRMFGHHAESNVDRGTDEKTSQWGAVIDILTADKDSRQALINIHLPQDRWIGNKDLPCTLSLQFFIREDRLHMITNMRSNDIILGFTNDVFQFTMIQECLMVQLRAMYPKLELGHYYHNAGSMHIYDRHFEMATKIIADERALELSMIPMDAFTGAVMTGLCSCEAAWQAAGAPPQFDFNTVENFKLLTPYWQNLVKFCFTEDHDAMHAMFNLPAHE